MKEATRANAFSPLSGRPTRAFAPLVPRSTLLSSAPLIFSLSWLTSYMVKVKIVRIF